MYCYLRLTPRDLCRDGIGDFEERIWAVVLQSLFGDLDAIYEYLEAAVADISPWSGRCALWVRYVCPILPVPVLE